jgi:hypothetical protein
VTPLSESGMQLVSGPDSNGEVLLEDNGRIEVWAENDDFAGYVIEIDGVGYEFVSSL